MRSAKLPNVVSHPRIRQVAGFPAGHSKPTRGQFPSADNVPLVNSDHRTKQTPLDGHPSSFWQSPGLCTTLKHPVNKGASRGAFNGRIRHLHTLSLISSAPPSVYVMTSRSHLNDSVSFAATEFHRPCILTYRFFIQFKLQHCPPWPLAKHLGLGLSCTCHTMSLKWSTSVCYMWGCEET